MMFQRYLTLREHFRALFLVGSRKPDHVKTVMDDLREFCRADQSCVIVAKDGHIDTHATAVAEGRREVFLRIQQTLTLSDETLLKLKETEDD